MFKNSYSLYETCSFVSAIRLPEATKLVLPEAIKYEYETASFVERGYEAKCLYMLRLKDKSVRHDSTFILLNLNKEIVNRNDFLKLPYQVNLDKFE